MHRSDTRVSELMSRGAIAVDEKLTLRSVCAVLAADDIGVVLIARPDGSAGVVSERDIVGALAEGADPDEVWAADVMSEELVIAEPQETIAAVAARMAEEHVRHIAVVDRGRVVGVVSARDAIDVIGVDPRSLAALVALL